MIPAPASPAKQFFVSMLTRDIILADVTLVLSDNCVDGALRLANGQDRFEAFRKFHRMYPRFSPLEL